MSLFAVARNAVRWLGFDLGRPDGAAARAVVLVDAGSGRAVGSGGASLATVDQSGRLGVVVTTNTSAVTGSFSAVQVLADATFSAWAEDGASGQAMTGFVVPAGTVLYGRITGYTLTSGKVRAYA